MRRPPPSPILGWRDLLPRKGSSTWASLPGSERVHLTYSGRGAIYQYLAWLRRSGRLSATRNVVLLPAFHCPNVVDPVMHGGFDVRFYAIDERLQVDAADFLHKLDKRVAVSLFIQFFGFPGMEATLAAASREAGSRVLEDCSHSFLYDRPLRLATGGADATTFSFWKLLPGKAGGGLLVNDPDEFDRQPVLARPTLHESWSRSRMLLGQILDERAQRSASPNDSDAVVPEAVAKPVERLSASEAYPYHAEASSWRMPAVSRRVLQCADLAAVVQARRRNYNAYARGLPQSVHLSPVYPDLPPQVCPWGFPVILQRRCERDFKIRARGVSLFTFGEVLHPLLFMNHATESEMLERARFLSDNLLALSIHQGIREEQVQRFAAIVGGFLGELTDA